MKYDLISNIQDNLLTHKYNLLQEVCLWNYEVKSS
jgi:hypothetical protein